MAASLRRGSRWEFEHCRDPRLLCLIADSLAHPSRSAPGGLPQRGIVAEPVLTGDRVRPCLYAGATRAGKRHNDSTHGCDARPRHVPAAQHSSYGARSPAGSATLSVRSGNGMLTTTQLIRNPVNVSNKGNLLGRNTGDWGMFKRTRPPK